VASSATLTTSLERHGDHVGSAILLVIEEIFSLVIAITVLPLLVQG
jgi:hypothetical protein